MAGEIGMARRVADDRAVAPAIGDVFQHRRHRRLRRRARQQDARRQARAVGHGDPDRIEDLEGLGQIVADARSRSPAALTDCRAGSWAKLRLKQRSPPSIGVDVGIEDGNGSVAAHADAGLEPRVPVPRGGNGMQVETTASAVSGSFAGDGEFLHLAVGDDGADVVDAALPSSRVLRTVVLSAPRRNAPRAAPRPDRGSCAPSACAFSTGGKSGTAPDALRRQDRQRDASSRRSRASASPPPARARPSASSCSRSAMRMRWPGGEDDGPPRSAGP